MIKVLIADDSAFMRRILTDIFTKEDGFAVLDTARNGKGTVEKVQKLKPDLLTLDINMPIMDGLEALEIIMRESPLPVVMVSSLTREGADATLKAMSLGAIDFICKPDGSISKLDDVEQEIIEKCRAAASAKIRPSLFRTAAPPPASRKPAMVQVKRPERKPLPTLRQTANIPLTRANVKAIVHHNSSLAASAKPTGKRFIVVGCSTGGPNALITFVTQLPASLPCAVLIVQHMPPGFTASLAKRLDRLSAIHVKEAEDRERVKPGTVYIAPGNYHMTMNDNAGMHMIYLNQNPPLGTLRPAADVLFESVYKYGSDVVALILTGMGQDGANGMEKIKSAGGYVIAESEETCVVYGMPKAVVERGLADEILPIQEIANAAVKAVGR